MSIKKLDIPVSGPNFRGGGLPGLTASPMLYNRNLKSKIKK